MLDRIQLTRLVDPFAARPFENLAVENLESRAMIEMLEVGEFMAQCVHEARILERPSGCGMPEPDPDRAI